MVLASDSELLGRYLFGNESVAFEELVRRHSTLVMNVCRTMLLNREDAEDAFQATFLVLSRKASKLVERNSIAGWLYHVAVRNCLEVRRLQRKKTGEVMSDEPVSNENEPWISISQVQDCELIHREIDNLPRDYRDAIVVCHVQGHSRHEAAELLNRSEASIKAALSRGRNMLRKRLIRRGLMTTALLAAIQGSRQSANAAVSESLIQTTIQTCAMSNSVGHTGPTSTIQTIAQNGVAMTNSLLIKSMLIATGFTVICLPLLVIAQSNEDTKTAVQLASASETDSAAQSISIQISDTSKPNDAASQVVDPRQFDINQSVEYWDLILKSLHVRLQKLDIERQQIKALVKQGLTQSDDFELGAQSYEIQAKILEAQLNIQRIMHEKKSGGIVDPRRIPPASTAAVRPGEVLEIKSLTDSLINDPRVVVQADHTVSLAFVGTVNVKGKSPDVICEILNTEYSKYLKNPNLFVRRYSAFDADRSFSQ